MKTTGQHTPGPWRMGYGYATRDIRSGHRHIIARVDVVTEEGEANARLIAAAPDLLAALETLAEWPRHSATADGVLTTDPVAGLANVRRFARDAVAKAAGTA